MLILVEGTIHRPVVGDDLAAVEAWLGPMVDDGFLQSGFLDHEVQRLWLIVSSPTRAAAHERLDDLPVVRDATLSYTTTAVTAVRFR